MQQVKKVKQMYLTVLSDFKHYLGGAVILAVLLIGGYFVLDKYFTKQNENLMLQGNLVKATIQATPKPGIASDVKILADAARSVALAQALAGQSLQLSAAQQTIANMVQTSTGLNARVAGALAAGLTKPSPKVQVITVGTGATSHLTAATPGPDDSTIQKDLKTVLNDPTTIIHTDVKTQVAITYEDIPRSPIFAAYTTNGSSGIGYTIHHFNKQLDLDALGLRTNANGIALGVGAEYVVKGTSAGIGVAETFDIKLHKPSTQIYAAIHL